MDIHRLKKHLQFLGLDEYESSVYTHLLKKKGLHVTDIKKYTGYHRPTVYKTLKKLEGRGLVHKSKKGKRTLYTPAPPNVFNELRDKLNTDLDQTFEELSHLHEARDHDILIHFHEGEKGIQQVFADVVDTLARDEVYYRLSSERYLKAKKYLPHFYTKRKIKKGLQNFVIASADHHRAARPRLGRVMKSIPKEFDDFSYNVRQIVYGEKVVFMDFNSETAIVIESKPIAEFVKSAFMSLYHRL